MTKLPANTGWLWVKEGFALFKKQPAEISTLFIAYMFLMLAVSIVPLLGQVFPLVLVPVFAMAFMQACVQIEKDERVYPNLLLTGFRSPQLKTLLLLGVLYLIAAVVAVAASALVDDGVFWKVMSGQLRLDDKEVAESNMATGMMFAALIYTPAAMAFWYAAPLIAWQKMGVGKAVFYSFFAVRNSARAFIVYGLSWVALGIVMPAIVSTFLAIILGKVLAMFILLPLSIMLTVVMYCSFYPTYTHVFGKPYGPAAMAESRLTD